MCLGIPGCIVSIDNADDLVATVDVSGVRRQINISCIVDEAHPVDFLRRRLGSRPCRFRDEPDQ